MLTPRIAERAAEIGDTFPRLLPPDCVHIATAIEAEADVLFTYEGRVSGADQAPCCAMTNASVMVYGSWNRSSRLVHSSTLLDRMPEWAAQRGEVARILIAP